MNLDKPGLRDVLLENHSAFTGFMRGISDVVARNSLPGKWTPNQQLDHIAKSVAPVKLALSLPKFILSMMFGRANRPSRSYDELVADYQARLAAGAKATARYLPDSSCDRTSLAGHLDKKVESLLEKMEKFSESELDTYQLPHPILGRITVREMLYFTAYHVVHHHKQVNVNMVRPAMVTVPQ